MFSLSPVMDSPEDLCMSFLVVSSLGALKAYSLGSNILNNKHREFGESSNI